MLDLSSHRFLVVDDHVEWRSYVTALLKGKGARQIDVASTGWEAIHLAVQHAPDLILMNIGLPDLNGFDVARRIRPLVPSRVLFITCHHDADFFEAAYAEDGHGCVLKSQAPSELLEAIAFALTDAH